MENRSKKLGIAPVPSLLLEQAIPASVGILVMSIYGIVDTIFVGKFVGALGIGATTVVFPITLLIGSIGMAIGVGGASIISRALGANQSDKAQLVFGNQIVLTLVLAASIVLLSVFFEKQILNLFGAKGDLIPLAQTYFRVIVFGIPFLAISMMSNNVIRSEGRARIAMLVMMIPALLNILLDFVFIVLLDMGIAGAGWATSISYATSASFASWYFLTKRSELRIIPQNLRLQLHIVKEIFSIGSITFARQGTIALLFIVLNNSLFYYGGELAISTYGILNRIMMIVNFPVLGVTQGFLPIAGYNYGAQNWKRVQESIKAAILYGTGVALIVFIAVMVFTQALVGIFTSDELLLSQTPSAIKIALLATPLLCMQLIGAAYYQAIGKALPALLLTLTKQGFCLIPLILILPPIFGIYGIWYAFPIADLLTAGIVMRYLQKGIKQLNLKSREKQQAQSVVVTSLPNSQQTPIEL